MGASVRDPRARRPRHGLTTRPTSTQLLTHARGCAGGYCAGSQVHSSAGSPQPEQTPSSIGCPHCSHVISSSFAIVLPPVRGGVRVPIAKHRDWGPVPNALNRVWGPHLHSIACMVAKGGSCVNSGNPRILPEAVEHLSRGVWPRTGGRRESPRRCRRPDLRHEPYWRHFRRDGRDRGRSRQS